MPAPRRSSFAPRWRPLRPAVALGLIYCAVQACTVETDVDICGTLEDAFENLSTDDLEAVFNTATSALADQGIAIDAVWTDPAAFNQYITEIYSALGCSPTAAQT